MSAHESPCPFVDVPAPWQCHGEAFCFFGYISSKTDEYPPPAAFGESERDSQFCDAKATGEYHGGLTSLLIIRYKETPVGVCSSSDFKVSSSSMHINPIRSL